MMHYGPLPSGGAFLWAFAVMAALIVVPFWRLLPRFGLPAPLAVIAIFPVFALILLWVMAFSDRTTGDPT